jgi:hypothetical protein
LFLIYNSKTLHFASSSPLVLEGLSSVEEMAWWLCVTRVAIDWAALIAVGCSYIL